MIYKGQFKKFLLQACYYFKRLDSNRKCAGWFEVRTHLPLLHGVLAKDRAEDHKRNPGEWSDEETDHQETEQKVDHRQHSVSYPYQDGGSGCFMAGSVSLSLEESGRSARARDGGGIGRAA